MLQRLRDTNAQEQRVRSLLVPLDQTRRLAIIAAAPMSIDRTVRRHTIKTTK